MFLLQNVASSKEKCPRLESKKTLKQKNTSPQLNTCHVCAKTKRNCRKVFSTYTSMAIVVTCLRWGLMDTDKKTHNEIGDLHTMGAMHLRSSVRFWFSAPSPTYPVEATCTLFEIWNLSATSLSGPSFWGVLLLVAAAVPTASHPQRWDTLCLGGCPSKITQQRRCGCSLDQWSPESAGGFRADVGSACARIYRDREQIGLPWLEEFRCWIP